MVIHAYGCAGAYSTLYAYMAYTYIYTYIDDIGLGGRIWAIYATTLYTYI